MSSIMPLQCPSPPQSLTSAGGSVAGSEDSRSTPSSSSLDSLDPNDPWLRPLTPTLADITPTPSSVDPTAHSKTAAFFFTSSPTHSRPPSPPLSAISKTASFFSTASSLYSIAPGGMDDWPTPPPSAGLRDGDRDSRKERDPPASPQRLLERLFPSRHTSLRIASSRAASISPPPLSRSASPYLYPSLGSPGISASTSRASSLAGAVEQQPHTTPPVLPPPEAVGAHAPAAVLTGPPHVELGTLIQGPLPRPRPAPGVLGGKKEARARVRVRLTKSIGQGAFSAVWLGEDESGTLVTARRTSGQGVRRSATLPTTMLATAHIDPEADGDRRQASLPLDDEVEALEGASVDVQTTSRVDYLVAVKLTPRTDERTRVSFAREVGILRQLSHPNIVAYIGSFTSTPIPPSSSTAQPTSLPGSHHILLLPYLPGGDLLSVVNSDAHHALLSEGLVRRMWRELSGALGWLHECALNGEGVVHRDVKLENILLTHPLPPTSSLSSLPPVPLPLVVLTDFGLARPRGPGRRLLTRRCGSEAYAAPELVVAPWLKGGKEDEESKQTTDGSREKARSGRHGPWRELPLPKKYPTMAPKMEVDDESEDIFYDADGGEDASVDASADVDANSDREDPEGSADGDDLVASDEESPSPSQPSPSSPVEEGYDPVLTDSWAAGVVLYALAARVLPFGTGDGAAPGERRTMLMRIARGAWRWPDVPETLDAPAAHDGTGIPGYSGSQELRGLQLIHSPGLRRVVEQLLVRDPAERSRVGDVGKESRAWWTLAEVESGRAEEAR